jgi:uncharacterized protein YsxB (DUF464 family)
MHSSEEDGMIKYTYIRKSMHSSELDDGVECICAGVCTVVNWMMGLSAYSICRSMHSSEQDDGVECIYAGVSTVVNWMMGLSVYVQEYAQ